MKKILKLTTILLCALVLFSCANNPNTLQNKTVKIAVANGSKTITPDKVAEVASYDFVLTSKATGKSVTKNTTGTSVAFTDVAIGSYTITVNGKNADDEITQTGTADFEVTIDGENKATIKLELISEGDDKFGTIQIPVDWSKVTTNTSFAEALEVGVRYELYIDGEKFAETVLNDNDDDKATLTFENIPVGEDKIVNVKIYNNVTNQMLVRNFFTSLAHVYAGQVSVPDVNEENSSVIKPNSIVSGKNISGIEFTFNKEHMDTMMDVTWNNPTSNGKNLAKEVVFRIFSNETDEQKITIKYEEENADNDLTDSTTIENLDAGKNYQVYYSVKHFSGIYSEEQKVPYTITPYVYAENLILTESDIPTSYLKDGDTFSVKAEVLPTNASVKTIDWTTSDSEVLTYNNGLFEAHKPGVATITATTEAITQSGEKLTETSDNEVKVILKSPSVYSEVVDKSIKVNWNAVPHATNYDIYEKVGDAEAVKISTVDSNTLTYTKDSGIIAGASYQYYVVATNPTLDAQISFDISSQDTTLTSAITPIVPNVTIEGPTFATSQEIVFTADSVVRAITPDRTELTFNITEIPDATNYKWVVNGTEVLADGDYTAANNISITKDTNGLNTDGDTYNTLMLVVTLGDGSKVSAKTDFEVIAVMDTGVEVYINGSQDGNRLIPTTDGTVTLSWKVTSDKKEEEPSNRNVTFESNDTTVATVDEKGIVTIHSFGDVEITVKTAHGAETTVNFKFYTPTFSSPLEILNVVNGILCTHFNAANTQFGADWWGYIGPLNVGYPGQQTYSSNDGIEIGNDSQAWKTLGYLKISNYSYNIENKGSIVLNTNGKITISAKDDGSYMEKGNYSGSIK